MNNIVYAIRNRFPVFRKGKIMVENLYRMLLWCIFGAIILEIAYVFLFLAVH